jgi:hypothetical protein
VLQVELSYDDARLLREVLEASLVELRREISHTDSREFKLTLLERRTALERLLQKVTREQAIL